MMLIRLGFKCAAIVAFVGWLPLITGCNKLLDAGTPANNVVTPQVYTSDSLAQAALIGIYFKIMEAFGPFNGYTSRYAGLSADELSRPSVLEQDQPFVTNNIPADNLIVREFWLKPYQFIYQCNDVIEGLTNNKVITPALRDQLLGEAYFLRAFSHFYLVNLFGDVPLVLTTDYTKSTAVARTPAGEVYDQMIEDLQKAQLLLTDEYPNTPAYPNARVRVNRLAASALLARVHLYNGQWTEAAAAATDVIRSGKYQLEDVNKTFLYTSKEAILQFMPINPSYNTAEGAIFVPVVPNGRPGITLCDSILAKMETGDARKAWIRSVISSGKQYHSPYKYKLNTSTPQEEYNIVLRLAELYCIRAEARAMLDQVEQSVDDINVIRIRSGLTALTTVTTRDQAMIAIEKERRLELFAEWGHRWFDLKRWPARSNTTPSGKRIDEVMSAYRPDTWRPSAALWPIPSLELIRNHALTQNPGYN